MPSILLINGPNLNLLGTREPHLYGRTTLPQLEDNAKALAAAKGVKLESFHSNHEGRIIDRIHEARGHTDAIIINPGAFTHTSVAIRDALIGVSVPFIEVHITNVHAREEFRHHSYLSDKAAACIIGLGTYGYEAAIEYAAREIISAKETDVYYLKHPPLPGKEGNGTLSLEVIDVVKGGDGHNTQVFTVRVLDGESTSHMLPQKGTRLVAKVYDPLYFNDDEGYLNPFLCMDKYYTHEANAYMVLRDFQGQWIPNYYGSYSLVLSVDSVRTRTVRMILVEYIPGITMADCEPGNFCQSARLLIRKSIVDLESRIYEKDILLTDLEPRNIIIRSPDSDRPGVVFIDFAHALFNRRRDDPLPFELNDFLGEYISPLLRWNKSKDRDYAFLEWIDWDWDPWLDAEFAHTAATITPEMRERWSDD